MKLEQFRKFKDTAANREPDLLRTPSTAPNVLARLDGIGILFGSIVICLLVSAGAALLLVRHDHKVRGTYVIGTDHSPPFQIVDEEGKPTGAIVEAVSLAASNLGIKLQWRTVTNGPDYHLPVADSGIDLWPLVMHLPERKDKFHISEPFAQAQYVLVSKQPYDRIPEDIADTAVIGHIAFPHVARYFHQQFPGKQSFQHPDALELIRAVCEDEIDAAAVEVNTLDTFLKGLPKNCGDGQIHARALPGWRISLGVGSRFGHEAVADAIRAEIGRMARSGELEPVFDRYFAYDRMRNRHLFTTTQQEAWTARVVLVMAAFVILVIILSFTVTVQRRRQRLAFAAAESRAAFLAAMSHEIRTPLSGVIGLADLLADSGLDPQQSSFVGGIRNSGRRLLTIVNDVLALSSLESGRLELSPESVALRPLLCEVLSPLAFLASQKNIPVVMDVAPDVPEAITVDPTKLSQVITNLVGNAVKFTESGVITFSVTRIPETETTSFFHFAVEDTGIGIAVEDQKKIFDSYRRGSGIQKIDGTGLGLSISRMIVHLMGGILNVSSKAGQGSKFWFDVPLNHPASKPLNDTVPPLAKDASVLVAVSPQPVQQALLSALLRHGIRGCSAFSDELASTVVEARKAGRCLVAVTGSFNNDGPSALPASANTLAKAIGPQPVPTLQLGPTGADRFRRNLPGLTRTHWGHLLCIDTIVDSLHGLVEENSKHPIAPQEVFVFEPNFESSRSLAQLAEHVDAHASNQPSRPRALVADDNPINQQILTAMLRKLGMNPTAVSDGESAIRELSLQSFAVILMDCRMPVMDGLKATRAIREMEASRASTPIIGVSAELSTVQRDACLAAGMNDYVEKPFTLESIEAALLRIGLPCTRLPQSRSA